MREEGLGLQQGAGAGLQMINAADDAGAGGCAFSAVRHADVRPA